jgi:hypothetical protein
MNDEDRYYFAGLTGELAVLLRDVEDRLQGNKPRALTRTLLAEARTMHDRIVRFHGDARQGDAQWADLTARLSALEGAIAPDRGRQ